MKSGICCFCAVALAWFALSPAASAAIILEQPGGTGSLPGTAQDFNPQTTEGIVGELLPPAGAFPGNYIDLYSFTSPVPFLFSAATFGTAGTIPDPQLFLFNGGGIGIRWNNDASISPVDTQAFLPSMSYAAGRYYLGISWFAVDPVDAMGAYLFDSLGSNGGTGVLATPLADWLNTGAPNIWDDRLYGIEVAFVAIPEPSTFGTAVLSSAALLLAWRRRS